MCIYSGDPGVQNSDRTKRYELSQVGDKAGNVRKRET